MSLRRIVVRRRNCRKSEVRRKRRGGRHSFGLFVSVLALYREGEGGGGSDGCDRRDVSGEEGE